MKPTLIIGAVSASLCSARFRKGNPNTNDYDDDYAPNEEYEDRPRSSDRSTASSSPSSDEDREESRDHQIEPRPSQSFYSHVHRRTHGGDHGVQQQEEQEEEPRPSTISTQEAIAKLQDQVANVQDTLDGIKQAMEPQVSRQAAAFPETQERHNRINVDLSESAGKNYQLSRGQVQHSDHMHTVAVADTKTQSEHSERNLVENQHNVGCCTPGDGICEPGASPCCCCSSMCRGVPTREDEKCCPNCDGPNGEPYDRRYR